MAELTKNHEMEIGRISLVPSDGGRFEVSVGDRLVFSKLNLGRHAEEGEVARLVGETFGSTE